MGNNACEITSINTIFKFINQRKSPSFGLCQSVKISISTSKFFKFDNYMRNNIKYLTLLVCYLSFSFLRQETCIFKLMTIKTLTIQFLAKKIFQFAWGQGIFNCFELFFFHTHHFLYCLFLDFFEYKYIYI